MQEVVRVSPLDLYFGLIALAMVAVVGRTIYRILKGKE